MSSTSPDLNLIKLRWAGNYLDGSPCSGTIEVEYLGPPMLDESTDFPIGVYPSKIVLTLAPTEVTVKDKDGNDVVLTVGYAELVVPASNDDDLIGSGGVYRLNERIHKGGGRANIDFAVDKDAPDAELWLNRVPGGETGNPELPSPVYWRDLNALAAELDLHILDPVKAHTHPMIDITGLQAALNAKQPAGPYVVNSDTRLSNARTPVAHSHDWDSITGKPSTFPATTHGHTIANVTGLQAALDELESSGGGGGPTAWGDITGKPTTFAPTAHTHTVSDVTGLQGQLDGKQAAGDYATSTELTDGLATKQPTGDYATSAEVTIGLSSKASTSHTHSISSVTGLQSELDGKQVSGSYATSSDLTTGLAGKANSSHTHTIANVTGLQAAIDGKQAAGSYAAASHTHPIADLPAGSTFRVINVDGTQARGTARTDVMVFWIGGTVAPTNAIVGDVWLEDV